MHRNTGRFTTGVKAIDYLLVTLIIQSERLTINLGRYTTHHVVTGRNNRNRLDYWVGMGKGSR